jgi:hypothetical protein
VQFAWLCIYGLIWVEAKVSSKVLELYELCKPVGLFHQKSGHLLKQSPLYFLFAASFRCFLRYASLFRLLRSLVPR